MTKQDRITREADFHNDRFSHDQRDALDKYYSITHRSVDWYNSLIKNNARDAEILEYGCGTGEKAVSLAPIAKTMTGIDISGVAVEHAVHQASELGLADKTKFSVMNAESLDFQDESFDLVYGAAILHHLDLHRAYSEIARVLRPSGSAVFLEPLGHNPLINWFRNRTPEMRTPDEHPFIKDDIRMANEYFREVNVRYFHFAEIGSAFLQGTVLKHPLSLLFSACDSIILSQRSPIKHWAWMCVLDLKK